MSFNSMAAITICSDFGAQKIKSDTVSTVSPSISHEVIISHARKVMLKILQARLQQYVNRELPVVQAGFRKGRRREVGKEEGRVEARKEEGNKEKEREEKKKTYFGGLQNHCRW